MGCPRDGFGVSIWGAFEFPLRGRFGHPFGVLFRSSFWNHFGHAFWVDFGIHLGVDFVMHFGGPWKGSLGKLLRVYLRLHLVMYLGSHLEVHCEICLMAAVHVRKGFLNLLHCWISQCMQLWDDQHVAGWNLLKLGH